MEVNSLREKMDKLDKAMSLASRILGDDWEYKAEESLRTAKDELYEELERMMPELKKERP